MTEDSPKPIRQLRKVDSFNLQPSEEIVSFLKEMLASAEAGRVQSLVMGWREEEEMHVFMAGDMFLKANLHLQFIGLLESMKIQLLDEFGEEPDDS